MGATGVERRYSHNNMAQDSIYTDVTVRRFNIWFGFVYIRIEDVQPSVYSKGIQPNVVQVSYILSLNCPPVSWLVCLSTLPHTSRL